MIELRADGTIPGKPTVGRVYRLVDLATGEIGYNMTSSDLPALDPSTVQMIEGYAQFQGWASLIIPVKETEALCKKLNAQRPKEFVPTSHTELVARVTKRLAERDADPIDGIDVLADLDAVVKLVSGHDAEGRGVRPPMPGWKR